MYAIICQDLTKTYGKKTALDHVSFTIAKDAITGLVGRNGAGKTTLLKCLAGFLHPDSGDIRVFEQNPYDNLAVSAGLIFVDESMNFPEGQTLAEIFALYRRFYPGWTQDLAEKLLDYFNLPPTQLPNKLSKGMLSTFRAILGLCAHAPLTIMDEPTSGMDSGVRQDFYRALLKDYIACPRTFLISTHLLAEIEDLLEYILLIDRGKALLSAPVTDVSDYALRLSGPSERLQPFLEERTVLHQGVPLADYLPVTVINDFTEAERREMEKAGISCSGVSLNDFCIALTAPTKGGIDRVFT